MAYDLGRREEVTMNMLKDQEVLIVGSGGFVGSSIAKGLSDNNVIAVTRRDFDLMNTVQVEEFFANHPSISTIIYCAAVGGSRLTNYDSGRTDAVEQNLRLFFNVARCVKPSQRLIHLGSGAEYDRGHYLPKMAEEYFDTHVPTDAYGFAKYVIAQFIDRHENMLNLRIFGLYGQGEDYRYKFISNTILKGLLGLPITIAQNVVFDYLFIRDFVKMVETLLSCEWPHRHMNITPTQSIDLISLAQLSNAETINDAGIEVLNPGLNTEYTGDNTRLLGVVGPCEFTSYQRGVSELTNYYRSVLSSIDIETIKKDPFIAKCIIKKQ